jgi:NTE family protein
MRAKWALVLSGGGARGLAHIGVLKAFEAAGFPKPDAVFGASMGAIIGGLYACGMSPERMENFLVNKFDVKQYIENIAYQVSGGPVMRFVQMEAAIHELMFKTGIDSGAKVLELLSRLTENKDFADAAIPFYCNAVDLLSGREVLLRKGLIAEAMRASASYPGVFKPVEKEGMLLADGGIADNLPVRWARRLGFRNVIAVRVGSFGNRSAVSFKNGIDILLRVFESATRSAPRTAEEKASIEIIADDGSSAFDFDRKRDAVVTGEAAANSRIPDLARFFASALYRLRLDIRRRRDKPRERGES